MKKVCLYLCVICMWGDAYGVKTRLQTRLASEEQTAFNKKRQSIINGIDQLVKDFNSYKNKKAKTVLTRFNTAYNAGTLAEKDYYALFRLYFGNFSYNKKDRLQMQTKIDELAVKITPSYDSCLNSGETEKYYNVLQQLRVMLDLPFTEDFNDYKQCILKNFKSYRSNEGSFILGYPQDTFQKIAKATHFALLKLSEFFTISYDQKNAVIKCSFAKQRKITRLVTRALLNNFFALKPTSTDQEEKEIDQIVFFLNYIGIETEELVSNDDLMQASCQKFFRLLLKDELKDYFLKDLNISIKRDFGRDEGDVSVNLAVAAYNISKHLDNLKLLVISNLTNLLKFQTIDNDQYLYPVDINTIQNLTIAHINNFQQKHPKFYHYLQACAISTSVDAAEQSDSLSLWNESIDPDYVGYFYDWTKENQNRFKCWEKDKKSADLQFIWLDPINTDAYNALYWNNVFNDINAFFINSNFPKLNRVIITTHALSDQQYEQVKLSLPENCKATIQLFRQNCLD